MTGERLYTPGEEVGGYRLGDDLAWHPIESEPVALEPVVERPSRGLVVVAAVDLVVKIAALVLVFLLLAVIVFALLGNRTLDTIDRIQNGPTTTTTTTTATTVPAEPTTTTVTP